MNKKLQGIIICVVVILCLGGTLLLLNLTGDNGKDNSITSESSSASDSKEDNSILIIDSSSDKVTSVDVSNKLGKFTIQKDTTGKTLWNVKELKGLDQSQSLIELIMDKVVQYKSDKLVEEKAENLNKYGLDNPEAEFTVNFSDKTKRTFLIGNKAPDETKYRYVTEKDSGKVYLVTKGYTNDFLEGKEQYVSISLIDSPEEVDFGELTISRKDLNYKMKFVQDTSGDEDNGMMSAQVMVQPIYSYLNGSSSQNVTHGLWGLKANSAVEIYPDDAAKKKYGITDPVATVDYKGEDDYFTLYIGNPIYASNENGEKSDTIVGYYCYLKGVDGKDCIWEIPADSLPWTTVVPEDIITTIMTYNNISKIDTISVEGKDINKKYELSSEEEELKSAKSNGKDVNVEDFKTFYQYFLSCPTSEIWYKNTAGDKFMTIKIQSDDNTDTLEFYKDKSSERKVVVKRNGQTSFRIPLAWCEKFNKNIESLENGGEIFASY